MIPSGVSLVIQWDHSVMKFVSCSWHIKKIGVYSCLRKLKSKLHRNKIKLTSVEEIQRVREESASVSR